MQIRLSSLEETVRCGLALGRLLCAGDVIALIGDLGAGKTTLTKSLAVGMGISEDVTSPTFTLVQEYAGGVPLFHFDVYRVEAEQLADIGFGEYFERGGVVLIEWADRVMELLPQERLTVHLTLDPDGDFESDEDTVARLLELDACGERAETLLAEFAVAWEESA